MEAPYDAVTLQGVSHWIPTEAPEELAEHILTRIDSVTVSDLPPRAGAAAAPGRRQPLPPRHRPGRRRRCPVDEAIAAAAAVGVTRIVQIGCDLERAGWAVEAAASYDALVAGVSLHPNEAPRVADLDAAMAEIERLAQAHDKVRAVGETGLDHFRTGEDGRAAQVESFRRHIDLAKRLDKTLVIHDRDAHDEMLRVLDEEGAPPRWVMHCFSGDAEFARRCLDRGAYLSFAGTVTFKNAEPLRDALRVTPLDRVLVETDAPFLTPTPYRGRTQRVVPRPGHDAGDGRGARRRPGGALRGRGRQHRARRSGVSGGLIALRALRACSQPAWKRPLPGLDCQQNTALLDVMRQKFLQFLSISSTRPAVLIGPRRRSSRWPSPAAPPATPR